MTAISAPFESHIFPEKDGMPPISERSFGYHTAVPHDLTRLQLSEPNLFRQPSLVIVSFFCCFMRHGCSRNAHRARQAAAAATCISQLFRRLGVQSAGGG